MAHGSDKVRTQGTAGSRGCAHQASSSCKLDALIIYRSPDHLHWPPASLSPSLLGRGPSPGRCFFKHKPANPEPTTLTTSLIGLPHQGSFPAGSHHPGARCQTVKDGPIPQRSLKSLDQPVERFTCSAGPSCETAVQALTHSPQSPPVSRAWPRRFPAPHSRRAAVRQPSPPCCWLHSQTGLPLRWQRSAAAPLHTEISSLMDGGPRFPTGSTLMSVGRLE